MSKIEVNQVSSQCGSTLTIGQSGDTVQLASGATQSGFGRTGTVNWDTTKKTASFTAVSGNGYFVDTSSSAITVTLPASPSAGDIVGIKDYAISFATNNCTIGRNSSNINGAATDPILETNGQSVFLVYVDATKGWIPTQDDASTIGALYVTATGGTITTCGDFKIHTFTSPGTFCVSSAGNSIGSNSVDYMVIAGGGGGGPAAAPTAAGGGGAGGYRESSGTASGSYTIGLPSQNCAVSALPVSVSPYPITVGGGGAANTQGSNSVFSTITSTGGGEGACWSAADGDDGGSGGGAAKGGSANGGSGNTPPVSPSQGNDGGDNPGEPSASSPNAGSGGGGAGAAGRGVVSNTRGGVGGMGATSSITGTAVGRAGGGGGGGNDPGGSGGNNPACSPFTNPLTSTTPSFGAGQGGLPSPGNGQAATANSGSGGGGAFDGNPGGAGGSGIVVIRYKYQ